MAALFYMRSVVGAFSRDFSRLRSCYRLPATLLPQNDVSRLSLTRSLTVTSNLQKETITVNYKTRDNQVTSVKAKVGENLLDIAIDNDLDLEGFGACEGTLACSTCHLIFNAEIYNTLPIPCEEELDMLDLAYGLTDRSRLGCQVCVTKEMDGMTVLQPNESSDARDV